MKIPYFYLEVGTIRLFQPGNITNNQTPSSTLLEGNGIYIRTSSYQEFDRANFYLNGRDRRDYMKFKKVPPSYRIEPYLNLIRSHNEDTTNV